MGEEDAKSSKANGSKAEDEGVPDALAPPAATSRATPLPLSMPLPTSVAKSISDPPAPPPLPALCGPVPFAPLVTLLVVLYSSVWSCMRFTSFKCASCSLATRSPISRVAVMNFSNCSALSKGPMDMLHRLGMMCMASVSRSTFLLSASCTARVAIMTLGSLVLILESKGTSFSVSVFLSKRAIMWWKEMSVLTFTLKILVLENKTATLGNKTSLTWLYSRTSHNRGTCWSARS